MSFHLPVKLKALWKYVNTNTNISTASVFALYENHYLHGRYVLQVASFRPKVSY